MGTHTCFLTLGGGGREVKGSRPCSAVSCRPDRATGAHISKQNRTTTKEPTTTKTSTVVSALNPTIWMAEDGGYVDQPQLQSKFHTSKGCLHSKTLSQDKIKNPGLERWLCKFRSISCSSRGHEFVPSTYVRELTSACNPRSW